MNNPLASLSPDLRRMLIPVTVGLLIFGAGSWWLLRTSWVDLDAPVSAQTRQEALSALQSAGVDYRTTADGLIQVPDGQAADARARLSGLGLAFPEPQGFELLDKADYTLSDFSQRLNYQRALEGELARTIMGLSEVRSARVHLAIAKQELFGNTENVSKASVTLQLKPGRELADESADGIREIVASSTEGLRPENVAIIDELGRPFKGGNAHAGLDQRNRAARRIEVELERRVRQLLQESYGIAEPYVSVRADMNFDRVTSVRDGAIPTGDATGYLTREQMSDSAPSRLDDGATGSSSSTREYAYGKERTETEFATGRLVRLSIAVALPASFAAPDLAALEKVVGAAIGLHAERGDKLVISIAPAGGPAMHPPADPAVTAASATPDADRTATPAGTGGRWIVTLVLLALGLLLAIGVLLLMRRKPEPVKLSTAQREQLLADLQKWAQG